MTAKELAIKCMEKLDIYKPYVKKFEAEGIPCFFENFAGFYVDQEPELFKKIKEVEQEHFCTVYAVTHEFFSFGETWSMLIAKDNYSIEDVLPGSVDSNCHYAFAYVWNVTNEWCSELGDVIVKSFGGGIKRLG